MPTRLLREGILSSSKIEKLSGPITAEVFYRRLMSKVDDHGLFDARIAVLRSGLFPLNPDRLSEHNCLQLLTELINAKLIIVYQIDGKPFLKLLNTKWPARSNPRYPPPEHNCLQLKATVSLDVVVDVVVGVFEVVDVELSNDGEKRTAPGPGQSSARKALNSMLKKPDAKPASDPDQIERNRELARKVVEEAKKPATEELRLDDETPF